MAKGKFEEYGPRKMPLIRSTWMTDKQWADAKVEFDATMRRMGKKVTWGAKPPRTCPRCGVAAKTFGAASGLCMKCSDAVVKELMKEAGL